MSENPVGAGHRSARSPVRAFVLISIVCLGAVGSYAGWRFWRGRSLVKQAPQATVPAPSVPAPSLQNVTAGPHIMFRSMISGPGFGKVTVAPLDRPNGPAARTDLTCERVYFAGGRGLCLFHNREEIDREILAITFDDKFRPLHKLPLTGFPSRARVSRDGHYAASTVLLKYIEQKNVFLTRTNLIDLTTGAELGNLEQFTVRRKGARFRAVDFNSWSYWSVTFTEDGNKFFATLASLEETYLVSGDIGARVVNVLRENVECPSLSPDGKRLAFRKRVENGDRRLHVLELSTLTDRPLASESRSVSDQVEWLDDDHVLYGISEPVGLPENSANIWIASVSDATPARVFVRGAISPTVVRMRQ